jgi:hypothetical protein
MAYPSSSLSPKEATAICALWTEKLHPEVDDICHIPLFEKTLMLETTRYGLPGVTEFKSLLTYVHGIAVTVNALTDFRLSTVLV